jgi:hypothetical protein
VRASSKFHFGWDDVDLRAVAPDHMTYSICVDGVWPAS